MPKPKSKSKASYLSMATNKLHPIACTIADIVALISLWYCSLALQATWLFLAHPYLLIKRLLTVLLGRPWRFLFPARSKPERYRAQLITDCERLLQQIGLVLFFLPLFFAYGAVEFSSVLHAQGKQKVKADNYDLLCVSPH
jgi:hypothetical protein